MNSHAINNHPAFGIRICHRHRKVHYDINDKNKGQTVVKDLKIMTLCKLMSLSMAYDYKIMITQSYIRLIKLNFSESDSS